MWLIYSSVIHVHPSLYLCILQTNQVVIYELSSGVLSEKKIIPLTECNVCAVQYSQDGARLAEGGSDKVLRGYDVANDYAVSTHCFRVELKHSKVKHRNHTLDSFPCSQPCREHLGFSYNSI